MGLSLDGLPQYSRADAFRGTAPEADCLQALQQASDNLNLLIRDTNAVITHDPLPKVQMPTVHVLELFQNPIENAIKYRGQMSPRIHVTARTRWDGNTSRLPTMASVLDRNMPTGFSAFFGDCTMTLPADPA
jgi:light-regulated signal transduction histidine kinase (bacteriophytochrome)